MSTGSTRERYVANSDWQVLEEYEVDGQQLTFNSLYTYGNYIDKVLYAFDMGSFWSYYYVHDHLYSPAALVDTSTPVPPRTLAKPFGFLLLFLFTPGFKKHRCQTVQRTKL